MTPSSPTVSVVLLSYNRPDYLRLALASVVAQSHRPMEILVVDNPSPNSNRIAGIVAEFPAAQLLRNSRNTGYTGGMNLGLKHARGEFVYLTEDDMVLDGSTLETLLAVATRRPEAGLVGPVVVQQEEPETVLCAGGDVRLGGGFRVTLNRQLPTQAETPVTFLPGNSLLARTELLVSVGGFREEFFMYYEDVELCQRMRHLGRDVLLVAGTKVGHLGSTKVFSDVVSFHCEKNFAAVNLLHAPAPALPMFCLRYLMWRPMRLVLTAQIEPLVVMRAWLWTAVHFPRLLLERGRAGSPRRRH